MISDDGTFAREQQGIVTQDEACAFHREGIAHMREKKTNTEVETLIFACDRPLTRDDSYPGIFFFQSPSVVQATSKNIFMCVRV